jgi:hypothetical protein
MFNGNRIGAKSEALSLRSARGRGLRSERKGVRIAIVSPPSALIFETTFTASDTLLAGCEGISIALFNARILGLT